MSSAQGRFTSPDPGNAGSSIGDPQSWNGYSYVSNNPLRYIDPLGLWQWDASLGGDKDNAHVSASIRNFRKNITKAIKWLVNQTDPSLHVAGLAYGNEGDPGILIGYWTEEEMINENSNATGLVSGYQFTGYDSNNIAHGIIKLPSDNQNGNPNLKINLAHEGTHARNAQASP